MNVRNADLDGEIMENYQDMRAPTIISTFCGCGGSSLGYRMAGFRELLAIDWDNDAIETFCLNFPDIPIYHGDITKLTGNECMRLAKIERGKLDVLDGSPPCQGFSTAGKRRFNDPRNSLFMEFVRLLSELRPKVFVMENVTGMVKGYMKQAYLKIVGLLRDCGYRTRGEIMNAMWFGVPQSRERVIIIGIREDLGIEPSHPKPQTKPISAGKALAIDGITTGWRGDIKNAQFKNKWRSKRLPSATLNASQPPMIRMKIHKSQWDDTRYITIEEAKILQSFPESFKIDKYRLIGNSVPPLMMKAIAEYIKINILERIK